MTSTPCCLKTQYVAVVFIVTSLFCDKQSYSGEPQYIFCALKPQTCPASLKTMYFVDRSARFYCVVLNYLTYNMSWWQVFKLHYCKEIQHHMSYVRAFLNLFLATKQAMETAVNCYNAQVSGGDLTGLFSFWKAEIEGFCRTAVMCYSFQQWRACPLSSEEIMTPHIF